MPSCAISHRVKTGVWTWTLISLLYKKAESYSRRRMYQGIKAGGLVLSLFFTLTFLQLVCDDVGGNPNDSPAYMVAVMSYMRDRRKWSSARVRIIIRVTVHGLLLINSACGMIVFVAALLLLGGDIEQNPGPNPSSPAKSANNSEGRGSPMSMTSQSVPIPPDSSAMMDALFQRLQQMHNTTKQEIVESQNAAMDSLKKDMKTDMNDLKESLSSQLKARTDKLQNQCSNLQKENKDLKGMINELSLKCDSLENHSRRNNLLFFGVRKDLDNESWGDCEESVREVISEGMGINEFVDIERAHRIKGNAIVVKLLSYKQKSLILSKSRNLKRTEDFKNVTVREDFSALVRAKRKGLSTKQTELYEAGKYPKMRFDKLVSSEGVYTYDLERELVVKLKEWEGAPQRGKPIRGDDVHEERFGGGAEGGEDENTQRSMYDWGYDPFGNPSADFPPLDRHQPNDDEGSQFAFGKGMEFPPSQGDPDASSSETRARRDSHIPLRVMNKSPMQLRQRSGSRANQNDNTQPKINSALGLQRGNTAQGRGQTQQQVRGGKTPGTGARGGRGRGGSTSTNR